MCTVLKPDFYQLHWLKINAKPKIYAINLLHLGKKFPIQSKCLTSQWNKFCKVLCLIFHFFGNSNQLIICDCYCLYLLFLVLIISLYVFTHFDSFSQICKSLKPPKNLSWLELKIFESYICYLARTCRNGCAKT